MSPFESPHPSSVERNGAGPSLGPDSLLHTILFLKEPAASEMNSILAGAISLFPCAPYPTSIDSWTRSLATC